MGKLEKVAAGVALSATAAIGLAMTSTGAAAAASPYAVAKLAVSVGIFPSGNVEIGIHNPNAVASVGDSTCVSAMIGGASATPAYQAFMNGDYPTLVALAASGDAVTGPSATNSAANPGPNDGYGTFELVPGNYLAVGVCGGSDPLSDPASASVMALLPVIVVSAPTSDSLQSLGLGSLAS